MSEACEAAGPRIVVFNVAGNTRYVVEISSDAKTWTSAVDRTQTVNVSAARNNIYDPDTVARPGLAEMEIFGILRVR